MIRARNSAGSIIAVTVIAVLLALEVTRLTIASAIADTKPDRAGRLAPDMPAALISQAMTQVGQAAAAGGNPSTQTFQHLRTLAQTAPLDPTPFLVEAALAERARDLGRAEHLLVDARLRDPRSAAARYLYADVAVREGQVLEALTEMAVLSRLLPSAAVQLVPALAQYARTPGARDNLTAVLAQNPQLKAPLLNALAADPSNTELVLGLAGAGTGLTATDTRAWQSRLVGSLIARGQYEQAYDLWRRFAGLPQGARPLLFNGDFQHLSAPHPFNWDFAASKAGFAEFDNGSLRVLYYGRDDASLASEMLVLTPGAYRFSAPIAGQLAPQALTWTLTCVERTSAIMTLQLAGPGPQEATFTVPASKCPAQRLQLSGQSQDMPQDSDVRIGPLRMQRTGS